MKAEVTAPNDKIVLVQRARGEEACSVAFPARFAITLRSRGPGASETASVATLLRQKKEERPLDFRQRASRCVGKR